MSSPRHASASAVRASRRPTRSAHGLTLGGWQLVGLVGEGALTRVFRARPASSPADWPADYAVKTVKPSGQVDAQAARLLVQEALVGREVAHQHLAPVLTAELNRRPEFVVMPFLEGATLARAIAGPGRVTLPMALWVARQVAEALAALHQAGWIHGDVKPANVLVSPVGHATLLDLGFAHRPHSGRHVLDRPFFGTLRYAAPELFTSTVGADARSDLYSLGATLFESIAGRAVFDADTPARLAEAHLRDVPADVRRHAPDTPRTVAALIAELLAKCPLRRPQTAGELVDRLAALEVASLDERHVA